MAARENRFSANRFSENGIRPIVLDDSVAAVAPGPTCVPDPKRANGGISAPEIVSVRVAETDAAARVVVSGRACAGTIVEIYQSHDVPEDRAETESREAEGTQLPSVGEFNYLGATNAGPDGTFEASFPLTVVRDSDRLGEIGEIWATDLLRASDLDDRGFSATAIDPAGNTSEMSGGVSAR